MNINPDPQPLIAVRNLSLGYGETVVLDRINLNIPRLAVFGVMGPSGVGKSALVRALTRQNDNLPSFWARGEALMQGVDLLTCAPAAVVEKCPLLAQKARLYVGTVLDNVMEGAGSHEVRTIEERREWALRAFDAIGFRKSFEPLLDVPVATLSMAKHKQILMARLLAKGAPCLFVDEPSPDVAVVEEEELLLLLEKLGQRIAVGLVTHNKQEARRVCDFVCLITGGQLIEVTPKEEFFSRPKTELGREFLLSGSCWPSATAEDTEEETVVHSAPPTSPAPIRTPIRDFYWAIPGLLGGMQQPGLLGNVNEDIVSLKELGVTVVVNLTEKPLYANELEALGLRSVHFPIPDMGVPEFEPSLDLCRRISSWIDLGQCAVLHCRAGLGRTGTIIACVLVCRGQGAIQAIETVRKINPRYIQTDGQLAFVEQFAKSLGERLAA